MTLSKAWDAMLWVLGAALLAAAAAYGALVVHTQWLGGAHGLSPGFRSMPEADFTNLWTAGRLARAHALDMLYSGPEFEAVRQHLFGAAVERLDWIYPPTVLILGAGFSLPPLLPAYALWLAFVAISAIAVLRAAGQPWTIIVLGLFGPAGWRAFELAQIAPLTGALIFAGLVLAAARPITGGLMLGLATLKPQTGLLAPVALLVRRNWACIAAAVASFTALVGISLCCFGSQPWLLFVRDGGANTRRLLTTVFPGGFPANGASVFWSTRALGASIGTAWTAQIAAAAAAAVAAACAAGSVADPKRRAAVICCLSPLASPYLYESDLIAYSLALAWLMTTQKRARPLIFLLWLWPGLSDAAVIIGAKPSLPLCYLAASLLAWRLDEGPSRHSPAATDTAG